MEANVNKGANIFFVAGAAKAGTTSIYHYLGAHPDIYVHPNKDVACYFCEHYGMPKVLKQFTDMLIPEGRNYKAYGDVCSAYLNEPNAAKDISSLFPEAKIIIILRDPVARAISLYKWMAREGYEYLGFADALEAEEERLSRDCKGDDLITGYKRDYLYFSTGLYCEQVKRFMDHFRRDQILVARYDDLQNDSLKLMREIYSFLGVAPDFTPDVTKKHNEGRMPLSTGFQYFCKRTLSRKLPLSWIRFLMRLNIALSTDRSQFFDPELQRAIREKYRQDITKTEELTGLDLSKWRT